MSGRIQRPIVGEPVLYRERLISVRLMGPDYLAYVGDIELGNFFMSEQAAIAAGQRYVNAELKAKEEKRR